MKERLIVGAAVGDCVHVAGVVNFLNLAEQVGYETVSLGPAVSVDDLLDKVAALDPALVAVGYRLTPENCRSLLRELADKAKARAGYVIDRHLRRLTRPLRRLIHSYGG